MFRSLILVLALAAPAEAAKRQVPWRASGPDDSRVIDWKGDRPRGGTRGIVVHASHRKLTLDCAGEMLAVDGNGNRLTLTGCKKVAVDGSGNIVTAAFAQPAMIEVEGDHNRVTWTAAPDLAVATSDIGRHNRIVRR